MSRSARPATRNEATRRLKPPKMTPCRTYHRHGHTVLTRTVANGCERLRTVANGCGRLRTVANGCGQLGNVERTHPQPPDPQSETGTLATHSGKSNIDGMALSDPCVDVPRSDPAAALLRHRLPPCRVESFHQLCLPPLSPGSTNSRTAVW